MKIILFARTLGTTRLCKISQESSLLFNFGSLPKIRNAHFGRCGPLGVNSIADQKFAKNSSKEHFVKYQLKLKDTSTFACVLCKRYNFFSKSIQIIETIVNKIKSFLKHDLQVQKEEFMYVCMHACMHVCMYVCMYVTSV